MNPTRPPDQRTVTGLGKNSDLRSYPLHVAVVEVEEAVKPKRQGKGGVVEPFGVSEFH